MKTTIDIPERELRDAIRFTKAKTKREAIVKILVEFNRRKRIATLVKYAGTFDDSFPTNEEIEALGAAPGHARRRQRPGRTERVIE